MKKKTIEKIPYLTLPETMKKPVKYIGVTALFTIAGEEHLFLEVYWNQKDSREVPIVRIVLTQKDFGNYFSGKATWTRGKIEPNGYYNHGFIWSNGEESHQNIEKANKENVLYSVEDYERIKKFCKTEKWEGNAGWWDKIKVHEDNIVIIERRTVEQRKYDRRQQALKFRAEHTPPLPEKKILKKANSMYFSNKHYLYYKKRGNWADIACSKCGGVTDGRWKSGDSYESQYQKLIQEPVEGRIGTCPLCGAYGEYKCQGKTRGEHSKKVYLFLGQKYRETGMVIRYIEVSKTWKLGLICGEKGPEMYNALEELSGVEIARAYFDPWEKKVQIDFHKHNPYSGKDFWDDCNLYGNANITIREGKILPETYENLKGTMFRYSAMQEYAQKVSRFNPVEYLECYNRTPQLEMLVKLDLIEVAKELVRYRYGIIADEYGNGVESFLGIRKDRVRQLMEEKGNLKILETMKMEYRMGVRWTDEQVNAIRELGLMRGQIETVTKYMSLQQFLNRIKTYAGCEYGTGCTGAEQRLQHTAVEYVDYLNMRHALGYDMTNTVYLHPKDLQAAHTKMLQESTQKEVDKRLTEVAEKFGNIRGQYRKLRNRYFYEDEKYIIRPARSAEEIVMEGRILHHCVGGDHYLYKHDTGNTYILMLRKQEYKDVPYITVEIDAENDRIRQWYGEHDRKPNEKVIQNWLDEYVHKLQNNLLAADQPAVQGVMIPA